MSPVTSNVCGVFDALVKGANLWYAEANAYSNGAIGRQWTVISGSVSEYAQSFSDVVAPHGELISGMITMVAGLSFLKATLNPSRFSTLSSMPGRLLNLAIGVVLVAKAGLELQQHYNNYCAVKV